MSEDKKQEQKKKRKPKRKVTKKQTKEEIQEEFDHKKYLNDREIANLEYNHYETRLIKKDEKILKQEIALMQREKEILSLNIRILEMKMDEKKQKITENAEKENKQKSVNIGVRNRISEKYNLAGNWGYDPESGELVEEQVND